MADWNTPTVNSTYTDVIANLRSRDEDAAKQFAALPTNPITDMIRWVSASNRWEKYNGATWSELSTAFAINVTNFAGQAQSYYLDISNMNAGTLAAARFNDTSHGNRGGGSLHSTATISTAGFMSAADKTKLDSVESNATGDQTAGEILTAIKTVDGPGSLLDADLLDGQEASAFEAAFTKNTAFNKNFGSAAGTVSEGNHNHTLDALSNTTITSNTSGEVLKWNGSAWINNTLAEAGISATSHNHSGVYEPVDTTILKEADVDDIPVNGATTAPISSNWAYDYTVSALGQQTIWIPAIAMVAAATNGAAAGSLETTSNKIMVATLDFDTATEEFAQFAIQMPKSWNESSIVIQLVWSHAATTTNFGVVWGIEAVALANANALDTAWGTEVTISDTGGTTDTLYISPESGAVTVGNTPAAEEWVVFRVTRVVGNVNDTMAIDARLHGIKIHYTSDALTDS